MYGTITCTLWRNEFSSGIVLLKLNFLIALCNMNHNAEIATRIYYTDEVIYNYKKSHAERNIQSTPIEIVNALIDKAWYIFWHIFVKKVHNATECKNWGFTTKYFKFAWCDMDTGDVWYYLDITQLAEDNWFIIENKNKVIILHSLSRFVAQYPIF